MPLIKFPKWRRYSPWISACFLSLPPTSLSKPYPGSLPISRYESLRRFYPLLKTGFDKSGCPINITLTGLIDPAKLVKSATLDEIRMYIIYEMEYKLVQLCKLTMETGIMYRALEVHDLKGLGMHHLAAGPITMLRKITSEVSSNYVELADKVLLLNVPYATVVRSVLKQVVCLSPSVPPSHPSSLPSC